MPKSLPLSPNHPTCRTKKKLNLIYGLFVCLGFSHCLPYLYHLGKEQSNIILSREKIEETLRNPNYDETTKLKLRLIQEVRNFAITKLALSEKGGFEYFTKLNRDEIGWNVSASDALEFKSYTWWFPIAGTVPYKGFFDKSLAIELENELKQKGYDTRIRTIGGYSTLGWFSDPILSPQLLWKDYRLVGLVIHEMAHATAYLPGDSDLNESYASFIEDKGVELFYTTREGENSPNLKKFKSEKSKRQTVFKTLKLYATSLNDLYSSSVTDDEKREKKKKIILEFKKEIISQKLIPEEKAEEFLAREWNNEDFLGALRYNSGEHSFEMLFQKTNRNFEKFHEDVRNLFSLTDEERSHFLNGQN
ncbi:aminopeptidase [Leptospira sp. 96542]|nr:aminopeptidase [Leptospira sp. 96542]